MYKGGDLLSPPFLLIKFYKNALSGSDRAIHQSGDQRHEEERNKQGLVIDSFHPFLAPPTNSAVRQNSTFFNDFHFILL